MRGTILGWDAATGKGRLRPDPSQYDRSDLPFTQPSLPGFVAGTLQPCTYSVRNANQACNVNVT